MRCCKTCALWTPEYKTPLGTYGHCSFDFTKVKLPELATRALITVKHLWQRTLETSGSDCSTFQRKGG